MIPLRLLLLLLLRNNHCLTTACPNCHPPTKCRADLHEPHMKINNSHWLVPRLYVHLIFFFLRLAKESQFWVERLHWTFNMKYCMPLLWITLVCIALYVCDMYNYVSQILFWLLYTGTILSIKIWTWYIFFILTHFNVMWKINYVWKVNVVSKYHLQRQRKWKFLQVGLHTQEKLHNCKSEEFL